MLIVWIEAERRPDVDVAAWRKIECRRHDADDGVRLRVELNRPADRTRRSAEVTRPERTAQDCNAIRAWLLFLRKKRPAERGRGAEHLEQIRRRPHARNVERLRTARERVSELPESHHRLDGARLLPPIDVGERRYEIRVAGRVLLPYDHEL